MEDFERELDMILLGGSSARVENDNKQLGGALSKMAEFEDEEEQ
jgi:hypothetical protein